MLNSGRLFCFAIYCIILPIKLLSDPVILDNGFKERYLFPGEISFYEDRQGSLLFGDLVNGENVPFEKLKSETISFRVTKSIIWLKLEVKNKSVYENYYLEIANPYIDEIRYYYFNDAWNEIGEGDENENKFSVKKTNFPVFPLHVSPEEEKIFYIRLKSHEYITLPISISREPFVSENIANRKLFIGFYNGAILTLLLYNIVLLILLRERIYLLSTLYISLAYYTFNYFYGSLPDWFFIDNLIPHINSFLSLASILSSLLTMEYFKTYKNAEKIHLFFKNIIYLLIFLIPLEFFIDRHFAVSLGYIISIFVRILIVITGLLFLRQSTPLGRLYTIGWLFLILGILIQILPQLGVNNALTLSIYSLQLANVINLIMISLAIIDKVYEFKKNQEEVVSRSIKTVEETKKMLAEQNEKLEAKVDERTKFIRYEKLVLEEKNNSLEKEISMAGKLQESLMPSKYLNLDNITYSYLYKPMMKVGGDFLDLRIDSQNNKLGIFICDISGHGIVASMIASMVKIALQEWEMEISNPKNIPLMIHRNLKGKLDKNFLTAITGCINLSDGQFSFANAGHPPLLYIPANGPIQALNIKGRMIMESLEPKCDEGNLILQNGDKIILYTDGITEVRNPDGEILDEEGFINFLESHRFSSPEKLVTEVSEFLDDYSGHSNPEDDCAMLVLEYRKI